MTLGATGTDYQAFAAGLGLLARLHDREVDSALVAGLRDNAVAAWFGAILVTPEGGEAANAFGAALDALPAPLAASALDGLNVAFADIHLTHGCRASPNGSVWLTEDGLERQEPMFEVRHWYRHYGVEVPDWRQRPDDNLVFQLQFVAHLLGLDEAVPRADAARFLDANLLRWLPEFARRIDRRCDSPFYRAVARLTAATVADLRSALARDTGIAIPEIADAPAGTGASAAHPERPFVPGQAESW